MPGYTSWNKHGEGVNDNDQDQAQDPETDAGGEAATIRDEEIIDDDEVAELAASPVPTVENLEKLSLLSGTLTLLQLKEENH